ncbi:MAG: helix-hairpin-helix domain-containing protein [Myxococcota bacterium]|nr:helix-hairpin-helix domain-containing protein [Myxococcota bacterium]
MSKSKIDALVRDLKKYNTAYRKGEPLISDRKYDELIDTLEELDPDNTFLTELELESIDKNKEVVRTFHMRSIKKGKETQHLSNFVKNVEKAAKELGVKTKYRVTPKLDGIAGYDDGILSTRGDGLKGNNITHLFDLGVKAIGGRKQGVGEVIVLSSYFNAHLSPFFSNGRAMISGLAGSDTVHPEVKKALEAGKIHFMPFSELAKKSQWEGSKEDLIANIHTISEKLSKKVDYDLDGMVVEVTNTKLHKKMGSTSKYNRWQLAWKGQKTDTKIVSVKDVVWQVGKSGKVTPVIQINPTKLSGAMISNLTGHNAENVKAKKLAKGAKIEIIRSGLVIPKIESVVKPAGKAVLPNKCPSCGQKLSWESVNLICVNKKCPARMQTVLRHWFKTIGNCNGFGPATIEILTQNNITTLKQVYALKESDLTKLGFGDKTASNLVKALKESRADEVNAEIFLASFGIKDLGPGDSTKILEHYKLKELKTISAEKIEKISGFAETSAASISSGIQANWDNIEYMMTLYTNIQEGKPEIVDVESPISGKNILFTGTMKQGTRKDMQEQAKGLGAIVSDRLTKKVQILVYGEDPSQSKIDKAEKYKINVLTEAEYLAKLQG